MEVNYFDIDGPFEVYPKIFQDERGVFFESFRAETFLELGIEKTFIQDNHSLSVRALPAG